MNTKQIIILWAIGICLCSIFLFSPKKYVFHGMNGVRVYHYERSGGFEECLRWDVIIPSSAVILIIGGLLIYTFKGDKK